MSTPVWCELVCDNCAATTSGLWAWGGKMSVKDMKASARKRGWTLQGTLVCCGKEECRKDHSQRRLALTLSKPDPVREENDDGAD
jgi:hypothetical protein